MASWNHIFSPTTVLEVKFGRNVPTASAAARQYQNPAPGFPDQIRNQDVHPGRALRSDPFVHRRWRIQRRQPAGRSRATTSTSTSRIYSKVIGRHSLKFGANYSRRHFSTNTTNPMDGSVNFDPSLTNLQSNPNSGDSFASMLLGLAERGSPRHGQHRHRSQINVQQYYVQDDWRVNNKLTVNLGLRYEYIPARSKIPNRLGNLVITPRSRHRANTREPCSGRPPIPRWIRRPASPANRRTPEATGRALMRNNYLDFAPRVGLAYQLNRKTVVRIGLRHLLQLHVRAGVAGHAQVLAVHDSAELLGQPGRPSGSAHHRPRPVVPEHIRDRRMAAKSEQPDAVFRAMEPHGPAAAAWTT